jgi:hypothetical protein
MEAVMQINTRIITTHLTINAPPDAVWGTLSDLDRFSTWNPFITSAAGTLLVGERLKLTIHPPGGRPKKFRPWVTAVEEHHYLEWIGHLGLPGIFDGRHSFELTPIADGRTLLQQSETFTGVLTPFAGSILARSRSGFDSMNEAMAHHAGSQNPSPAVREDLFTQQVPEAVVADAE